MITDRLKRLVLRSICSEVVKRRGGRRRARVGGSVSTRLGLGLASIVAIVSLNALDPVHHQPPPQDYYHGRFFILSCAVSRCFGARFARHRGWMAMLTIGCTSSRPRRPAFSRSRPSSSDPSLPRASATSASPTSSRRSTTRLCTLPICPARRRSRVSPAA